MIYYRLTNISGGLLVCDLSDKTSLRLNHKQSAVVSESKLTSHIWNLIENYIILCEEAFTSDEEYNPPDTGGDNDNNNNDDDHFGDNTTVVIPASGVVRYDVEQNLSNEAKARARKNTESQKVLIEYTPEVVLSTKEGLEGRYSVLMQFFDSHSTYLVKVSDLLYTSDELIGLLMRKYDSNSGLVDNFLIKDEDIEILTENGTYSYRDYLFVVSKEDKGITIKGAKLNASGVYIIYEVYSSNNFYYEVIIPEVLKHYEGVSKSINEDSDDKTLPTTKAVLDFVKSQTQDGLDLSSFAEKKDIPTKMSQLNNDKGFVDESLLESSLEAMSKNSEEISEREVSEHNVSDMAHSDLRLLIMGVANRLNALANSDDTTLDQMAEIVAYIKSNRELVEAITTSKVNVSDIVNDLMTNVPDKPLSASQGVVLKRLIETKIEEVKDGMTSPSATDEVYVLGEGETESDIPEGMTLVIFPEEEAEEIDWSNYYNKEQINEIIRRADFKKGKSAYEVAIEGMENPPTVEEWLASLKGDPFTFADFTAEQLDLLRFKFEHFTEDQLALLKGDPFTYEDFTPEQLEGLKFKFKDFTEAELKLLKGEPFTYDDFTEEQLEGLKFKFEHFTEAELQGLRFKYEDFTKEQLEELKGEPFKYEDFTPEQLEALKPKKNVDYFDGKDGLTPQRGVHYWTNEDIATIQTYIDILVAELVDSAPDELNTLWELANALGNDPNFATTVLNKIGEKVEKVDGKGLSTNDYTTAEKNKLAGISENANNYSHPSSHPASMITGLSPVATSGKYTDLSNIPRITKKGQPSISGYYLLGTLPAKGSTSNYASFTLNGRFGGWETSNSSTAQIMLMNRGGISGTVSMCCTATDISRIWSVFDIVVSEDSSGIASIYLKCNNYFLYDFEWMTFDGTFLYNDTYTTTAPSNIVWQLSTAPKTILKADGSFEASGGINASQFAGYGLRIVTDENDKGKKDFLTVII